MTANRAVKPLEKRAAMQISGATSMLCTRAPTAPLQSARLDRSLQPSLFQFLSHLRRAANKQKQGLEVSPDSILFAASVSHHVFKHSVGDCPWAGRVKRCAPKPPDVAFFRAERRRRSLPTEFSEVLACMWSPRAHPVWPIDRGASCRQPSLQIFPRRVVRRVREARP
jgi:hypothetical protein